MIKYLIFVIYSIIQNQEIVVSHKFIEVNVNRCTSIQFGPSRLIQFSCCRS